MAICFVPFIWFFAYNLYKRYKYTYTIKLKATYVIGKAGLRLKPNILRLNIDNTLNGTKFAETSNNLLIMSDVQIKLK